MSDKSFGDHTNRGVVKNPLLSNVVTGLSLDDLTQKAVLLPVSPPLGVIAGSENTRPTSHTLADTQHDQPIFSSGDADKNYSTPNIENSYKSDTKKIVKQHEISDTSLPKDSVKADDDFDVNEYFARLQGTRYVSAPIHSHIKDDQSADTEDNLEEINLNEPDKSHADVQQSLTADIAQNFSQLPTVLPHVASAVFSSFSSMLNLKSREQTPDTSKPVSGYREAEVQNSESTTVPLMSVDEPVRNIGPPPKESPIGGSGNYRITTKKKYAQIPGLTCRDTGPSIYSAPLNPNTPLSFTPTHIERDKISEIEDNNIDKQNLTQLNTVHSVPASVPSDGNFKDYQNVIKETGYYNPVDTTVQYDFKDVDCDRKQNTYNIFNPAENYVQSTSNISNWQAGTEVQPELFEITNRKEINDDRKPTSIQDINMSLSSAPVVPPPPMFTNISRDRPSVRKSILPPSVARRISANQPIIKPQSVTPVVVDNIFTPTLVRDTYDQSSIASDLEDTVGSTQSSDAVYSPPTNIFPQSPLQFTTAIIHASPTFYTSAPNTQIQSTEKPSASKPTVVSMFMPAIDTRETKPTSDSISSSKMSVDLFIASKEESQKPLLPYAESVAEQSYFKNFNTEIASSIQAPEECTLPMFDLAEATYGVPSSDTITSSNMYPPVIGQPQSSVSFVSHVASSQTEDENKKNLQTDQAQCAIKFFDPGTLSSEPSLPITEPPKTSNSFNYRMTKKKPQYYSGPIDGFGSISNNVKPVIYPGEAGSFSGALFTPEQQLLDNNNVEKHSMPFDINKSTPIATVPFDINKVRVQPDYDTSFDLSRQTTQMEIPKQESKGFGIIGSLKSKLSSIDINKIQNSVTTFFDPGYNDVPANTADRQENVPYYHQNPRSRKTSFDVYIPAVQLSSEPHDGQIFHDIPHSYHNTNKTQNTFDYYQNLERDILPVSSYFTYPDNSISMQPTHNRIVDSNDSVFYSNYTGISQSDITKPDNKNVPKTSSFVKNIALPGTDNSDTETGYSSQKQNSYDDPASISKIYKQEILEQNIVHSNKEFMQDRIKAASDLAAISFFDTSLIDNQAFDPPLVSQSKSLESRKADDSYTNKTIENIKNNVIEPQTFPLPTLDMAKQDKLLKKVFDTEERKIQALSENKLNFVPLYQTTSTNTEVVDPFMHIKLENQELCPEIQIRETNLLESLSTDEIPIVAVSSVPLFGLSTIIAEKPKETIVSEGKKSEGSLTKTQRPYDKKAVAKFFENIPPREIIKPQNSKMPRDIRKIKEFYAPRVQEPEIESDLNICETCREVNKHEERETEDLTTQLIENITAPIQLSNPVEAPFTDGDTTQTRVEFDRDQYEKLSRIAEDTIESIHMHSADELLNDAPIIKPRGRSNFGWNVNNSTLEDDDDVKFKQEPLSSDFYENNVPFLDKVLSNVIEDIKTEFHNTNVKEQASAVLDNALPTVTSSDENDSRSEAVGHIDVHMIEQDANRDFPLYVIEPSDSEDDMDTKEIEKFEDTGIRMESFTNRIERFKKRKETKVDNPEIYGQNISSVSSPSVPIASYFDTGNYAAETHYRNSLYSTSSGNYMGTSSHPMRIPPGFEEEYHRRMSGVSNRLLTSCLSSDSNSNKPIATETSTTMTKELTSTYLDTDTRDIDDAFDVQSHLTNFVDESETPPSPPSNKLRKPILAMIFDADSGQIDVDYKDTMAMKGSDSDTEPPYVIPGHKVEFVERENDTESFSRLASYFDSPPKTEHSKSFFELSQSENHYRNNNSNENKTKQDSTPHSNESEIRNYAVNRNLMRELTSSDNMEVPEDDANRTVHYFSYKSDRDVKTFLEEIWNKMYGNVDNKLYTNHSYEYDLDEYIKNSRGFYPIKPESNCETFTNERKSDSKNTFNDKNDNLESVASDERDDKNPHTFINKCDICSNYININEGNYKFRKLMNNSAASDKEIDRNMAQNNEHHRRSVTVNFDTYSLQDGTNDGVAVSNENRTTSEYTPVKHHWFYRVDVEDKSIWRGFSVVDSTALEEAYVSQHLTEETVVATDGGRYDVNIVGRIRRPVYWNDKPTNVRRCSWFYKGTTDARYVPYTENVAEKLEEEYRHGMTTGEWHRQLILPNNELVVMHGPSVMVHFLHGGATDPFSTSPSTSRPRVVRRGHDESEIEDTEPSSIDHILLLCHGVGSACDMRFRNVEEVVDDFRATSLQLVQSHYRNSYENGTVNRVEVLPISWHSTLHSGEDGVDRRLAQITLDSIPRLRNFTNDTVLDVLFYTSPVYCQTIIDTVCNELNRIYSLFLQRNPSFKGGVSLGGHSLGSVILYDLLCHQEPKSEDSSADKCFVKNSNGGCSTQPNVKYPKLIFNPAALYALGSPIAIFECIRGVESLGMDFALPTCKNFFNIFHPYDPIAYRIEPLINPQLRNVKPLLVPHHKGRKRMHLELKDTMVRVGADLKQKFIESIRTTWNKWKTPTPTDGQLEKVVEEEMEKEQLNEERKEESTQNETVTPDMLGKLNGGRRIDYVLQEAPLEVINEYLFAMSSHVGYCFTELLRRALKALNRFWDVWATNSRVHGTPRLGLSPVLCKNRDLSELS